MSLEIYIFRLTRPIDIILFHHLCACDVPVIEKPLLIGLDWICLTTTHVLQDILAVLHK